MIFSALAVAAVVTPGDWPLYRGTSIVSRHASLEACVEAAKALNVARTYTCRTSTGVAVTVTVDPPPPPPPPSVTVSASFNPASIAAGESASLVWSSTGATSCSAAALGQTAPLPGTSGSLNVGPQSASLSVVVTCGSASATAALTVASAPPPPPPPPVEPPPPGGDLCANLPALTTTSLPPSSLARPARGVPFADPKTGARVMRITDASIGAQVKPAYSTVPAWNADESLLILYAVGRGHVLLNGRTYAFIRELDINPADLEQFYWSSTDPDLLYYVDNREASGASVRRLLAYRVSTGASTVVKDWSAEFGAGKGYNAVRSGNDPLYTSTDNRRFGQGGRLNRNGPNGASLFDGFIFNAATGQRSPLLQLEGIVPQPSPSGRYAIVPQSNGVRVLNADTLAQVRTLAVSGEEHGDLLTNAAGHDVWASIQFDGPSGSGTLIAANLDTGAVRTIIGEANGFGYPPSGTHISGRAVKAPGWVAVSVTGSSNTQLLGRAIVLANIDTGRMCYAAHHRSTSGDYWAEPHVVASPSGTRLLFGSDWGGNGTQVDTYVVELPAYRP